MLARLLIPALVVLPTVAFGWGFTGHRRLASHLHEPFPQGSCLRGWLSQVTGQYAWQDKSCDPDRWRNSDPVTCDGKSNTPLWCEWPRHYLDIDYANPIQSYPRDWTEAELQFKQYAVSNGRVPWRVEELYGQLVDELRAKSGSQALETVAFLSHYVTDAASPMHTTKSQPGTLHTRYESDMFSNSSRTNAIATAMRGYYGKLGRVEPKNHTFELIAAGLPLSQKIIMDDFNDGASMEALYANTADLTARRWADGLTLMASLVGTAWVEAGSPMLAGMQPGCDASFPQTPVEVVGYPFPSPAPPDAGTPAEDGGTDAGTGSTGGGGGGTPGTPAPLDPPKGSSGGCSSTAAPVAAVVIPWVVLGLVARRRAR